MPTALLAAALVCALVSLTYPHARDQAAHAYIGLRWLEGAIPYRDTIDIKPPGVFFAHAVAIAIFGKNMVAIRALDLVASVLPASVLVARACTLGVSASARRDLATSAAAIYALLYFGTFEYAFVGETETWCNLASAVAIHAAATSRGRETRAAVVLGLAAGAAFVFKLPAVLVPLACFAFVCARSRGGARWRSIVSLGGAFGAAAVVVVAPVVAYFAAKGALGAAFDVLVTTTARYSKSGGVPPSLGDSIGEVLMAITIFGGLPIFVLVAAWARARSPSVHDGTRAGYRLGAVATLAATLVVVVQRKFFFYHWVVLVPPLAFLAGVALADEGLFRPALARRSFVVAVTFVVALLGGGDGAVSVLRGLSAVPRVVAARDPALFYAAYEEPLFYSVPESAEVAKVVVSTSRAEDNVLVRGFEPQIYLLADRRYHGRFFWSLLVSGSAFAQEDRFRDEDCRAFLADPPRVVVASVYDAPSIVAPKTYEAMGYRTIARTGAYTVLERDPSRPLATECGW